MTCDQQEKVSSSQKVLLWFFLFVEKITVIPIDYRKLFPVDHKSPWCIKKIRARFLNESPPAKPSKQKETISSWKIIEVTVSGGSGRGRISGVIIILLKLFFFKFLILSTGVPRRRSPPEIAARWRYRLPSNNLTAHYNSQFCVSFHIVLTRKPRNAGLNWAYR